MLGSRHAEPDGSVEPSGVSHLVRRAWPWVHGSSVRQGRLRRFLRLLAAKMSCTVSRRHAACSDEYNPPCQHTRRGCDRLHAIRRAMRARAVFGGGGEHEGDGPAQ
jgi:hypothetical protein